MRKLLGFGRGKEQGSWGHGIRRCSGHRLGGPTEPFVNNALVTCPLNHVIGPQSLPLRRGDGLTWARWKRIPRLDFHGRFVRVGFLRGSTTPGLAHSRNHVYDASSRARRDGLWESRERQLEADSRPTLASSLWLIIRAP